MFCKLFFQYVVCFGLLSRIVFCISWFIMFWHCIPLLFGCVSTFLCSFGFTFFSCYVYKYCPHFLCCTLPLKRVTEGDQNIWHIIFCFKWLESNESTHWTKVQWNIEHYTMHIQVHEYWLYVFLIDKFIVFSRKLKTHEHCIFKYTPQQVSCIGTSNCEWIKGAVLRLCASLHMHKL